MRYSRYLGAVQASLKLQLPHEQYAQLAVQLPVLVQQAAWPPAPGQQAAAAEGGVASLALRQGGAAGVTGSTPLVAGTVRGAPCLLRYTHVPGCLTAILEYAAVQRGAPVASQLAADLQLLLPSSAQLVHLSIRERGSGHSSGRSTTTSLGLGGAQPAESVWPDPVVLLGADASCAIDVVLPAPVLQQLLGTVLAPPQLRVLVTAAAGGLLSDSVHEVTTMDEAGGRLKVRSWAVCAPHSGVHAARAVLQPALLALALVCFCRCLRGAATCGH
jgi:hypothetical protein